jgi:hypothetical protein
MTQSASTLAQPTLKLVNSKTSALAYSTMALTQSTSAPSQSVAFFSGKFAFEKGGIGNVFVQRG